MTITVTDEEFQELCEEDRATDEAFDEQNGSELRVELPKQIGKGGDRTIYLRNGLYISIITGELWHSLHHKRQHEEFFPLVSKFYLSGGSRVLSPGVKGVEDDYEEICGHNYLYYLPEMAEIEQWSPGEQIQFVMVCVEIEFLQSFYQSLETLPNKLRQIVEGTVQRFHQPLGVTTPTMQQVLHQMLNCAYHGLTKQIYLESKALELVALQLAQWDEEERSGRSLVLRSDDVERLHQAKHILVSHADNPPSLLNLAQMVGINDRKLKQGFRQIFGTTVFGYLQVYRMEQAKRLLAERSLSVAGVAHAVGYTSPSRFCDAFKRQFGITPKAYQIRLHS